MNNIGVFNDLRVKHTKLTYHSYEIKEDGFDFHFSIGDIDFRPSWRFSPEIIKYEANTELLSYAVFNLGMAELVSYWKCACPPVIEIKCGLLSDWQVKWWKKFYLNGLGEFFYINGIDTNVYKPGELMKIIPDYKKPPFFNLHDDLRGSLIPVGGGKDSIVTMELLRESFSDNYCYIINPREHALQTARCAGYGDGKIIKVYRTIDKELIRLNSEGYMNGHTPFSGIVAFSSWIFAYLSGKQYIALSNESSSDEGNITGASVNHQYSKSTEFEFDFRQYAARYFGAYPEYFSLLRPWSEWQITKVFAGFPQYLEVFLSCNAGHKTDSWCGKCAKCLYVFIMLSAFADMEKLEKIFGGNMLDNVEFENIFNGLVYEEVEKPFECVGTKAEINLALQKTFEKNKNGGYIPLLLKKYMEKNPVPAKELDNYYNDNNYVPEEYVKLLRGGNLK